MTPLQGSKIAAALAGGALALGVSIIAAPALAQSMTFDLGDAGPTATGRIIQLVALMTVLTLVWMARLRRAR